MISSVPKSVSCQAVWGGGCTLQGHSRNVTWGVKERPAGGGGLRRAEHFCAFCWPLFCFTRWHLAPNESDSLILPAGLIALVLLRSSEHRTRLDVIAELLPCDLSHLFHGPTSRFSKRGTFQLVLLPVHELQVSVGSNCLDGGFKMVSSVNIGSFDSVVTYMTTHILTSL